MATRIKKDPVSYLTISEIKAVLKEKNLSTAGSIDVLRARLRRRYELEEIMTASESEEEEVEEDQEEEVEEDQEEEVEEDQEEEVEEDQEEEVEEDQEEVDTGESEDEEGKNADAFDYMETRLDDLEEKIQTCNPEEMEERMKAYVKAQMEIMFAEYSKKGVAPKLEVPKPEKRTGKFYECALDEFISEEDLELEEKISDSKSYPVVTLEELDKELKEYMSGHTHLELYLPHLEEAGMSLYEFLERRGEDTSKLNFDTKICSFKLGEEIVDLDPERCKTYETYVNGRTITFKYCRILPIVSAAWIVFLD